MKAPRLGLTDALRVRADLPQHGLREGDFILPLDNGETVLLRQLTPEEYAAILTPPAGVGELHGQVEP